LVSLQRGIALNKQNAPLNHDMSQLIDRVRDGSVIAAPVPFPSPQWISPATASLRTKHCDSGLRRARACYQAA
jgi:hypothetical protein